MTLRKRGSAFWVVINAEEACLNEQRAEMRGRAQKKESLKKESLIVVVFSASAVFSVLMDYRGPLRPATMSKTHPAPTQGP